MDPETLVLEEIENNSKLGLLLEYSVRLDRTIHPDVVTKLMECKMNSAEASHAGFVVAGKFKSVFIAQSNTNFLNNAGIPMIPCQETFEDRKPMVTESAVFTVEQTLHELLERSIVDSAIRKKAEYLFKKHLEKESDKESPGEDGTISNGDKQLPGTVGVIPYINEKLK